MNFLSKHFRWVMPLCFALAGGLIAFWLSNTSGLTNAAIWREANLFWMVGGSMTTFAVWAVRVYPTKVGVVGYGLLLGILAAVLSAYTDISLLRLVSGSDRGHLFFLDQTAATRYFIALSINVPVVAIAAANKRIYELDARFSRQSGAEGLLREAELFKLRQQLQPHFLYNSLNAINALVLVDAAKAQEMVGRLADFLRASVRKESNELLPVAEELAYLESYLSIESVRFGDRLQVVYHKAYTEDAQMPPFLLQPLIENAIKFGLNGQPGQVTIRFDILLEDRMLILCIANPYDPLMAPPAGTGFGLDSVRRRLYLLYGRDDLVQTEQHGHQFTTTLKIPQLHVQNIADR